jgi:hypothetical protein
MGISLSSIPGLNRRSSRKGDRCRHPQPFSYRSLVTCRQRKFGRAAYFRVDGGVSRKSIRRRFADLPPMFTDLPPPGPCQNRLTSDAWGLVPTESPVEWREDDLQMRAAGPAIQGWPDIRSVI